MDPVESLCNEPISRLGPFPLHVAFPEQTVADALALMQEKKSGCIVVCRHGHPVGVITERDILRRVGTFLPLDVPLSAVLKGEVWSVREGDRVGTAIKRMTSHQCRHLVVVSDSGIATGILSVRAILHGLVEAFPASIYNLPPVASQVPQAPEGA